MGVCTQSWRLSARGQGASEGPGHPWGSSSKPAKRFHCRKSCGHPAWHPTADFPRPCQYRRGAQTALALTTRCLIITPSLLTFHLRT